MSTKSNYAEKIQREQAWHQEPGFQKSHFLNSRLFYSPERVAFNDQLARTQLANYVRDALRKARLAEPRMLIAPLGCGHDLPYLAPLSPHLTGIDVCAEAVEAIAFPGLEKCVGDMKRMAMFKDAQFDVVVISQFFHHFLGFGFDAFLLEALRVLRPGGLLFSMEPCILHPFALGAWCGKKLLGNISGCVEDESPFYPGRLTSAMRRCGFQDVTFASLSYSHHRMPILAARLLTTFTRPVLRIPPFKYFAWAAVFCGRKPGGCER